jgi:DNA-binding transcriptional ArsR family regulator
MTHTGRIQAICCLFFLSVDLIILNIYKTRYVVAINNQYCYIAGMKQDYITKTLSELGNETRLAIFRLLIKLGNDGATVGEIVKRLKVPPSTLGFHLRGLVGVGLVSQKKVGRSTYCYAEADVLRRVLRSLEAECCEDQDDKNTDQSTAQ